MELPHDMAKHDATFALEPRIDTHIAKSSDPNQMWPTPTIVQSVAGRIRIPNLTDDPLILKRQNHFGQIRSVYIPCRKGRRRAC